MRRRTAWWAIVALCGSALFGELLAYAAVWYGLRPAAPHFFYERPAVASSEQIARYFRARDPLLGWTSNHPTDASGARPSLAFPMPGNACVSVYGDSFVWSSGASSDTAAWPEIVARMLGCRIANYGVGGYGVDQA